MFPHAQPSSKKDVALHTNFFIVRTEWSWSQNCVSMFLWLHIFGKVKRAESEAGSENYQYPPKETAECGQKRWACCGFGTLPLQEWEGCQKGQK